MQAGCVLFVTAFGLPPAPYRGFGIIGAGRWQLRLFFRCGASVTGRRFSIWLLVVNFNFSFSIGLQFRADEFQIPQQLPSPDRCTQFEMPALIIQTCFAA